MLLSNKCVLELEKITKVFPIPADYGSKGKSRVRVFADALLRSKPERKENKQSFKALNDISFSLDQGQSLGIIGLNGSGKSTLLQIISGTLKPSAGIIKVENKVAALLELGAGFNPDFTGIENIYINAQLLGLSVKEIKEGMDRIIGFADIGDFVHQPVRTYSSGMSVRLAFAIVANTRPEILIIDEALAVGDARFQLKCFAFLEEFQKKGGSLILVSHDLNSIARLCSQAILLHKGKLRTHGVPIDVINEYSKILSLDGSSHSLDPTVNTDRKIKQILDIERKSKEFAYGGNEAIIKEFQLLNQKGVETQVIKSGEKFTVSFLVLANEKITEPIYAMTIKDAKGLQIYGQNTHFAKILVEDMNKGQQFIIKFQQQCNLGAGDYFISLGLTRFVGDNLKVIHRRYEALEFKVISADGSFGLANCFSEIMSKVKP
tara:strand:+ start:2030 stop:3331 length:1302 start_codon:yes stop_codon:yes gene_type:complete